MTQTVKTLIFVAAAAASVAVAAGTFYSNKPADIQDFSDVGDQFFPKFEDPNVATGLRVAAYNEATGKTEIFNVENKNGLWQIPSHHDYPADGKERLAKTAASMIGVVREALVERTKSAQKRYDVLDPLDSELSGTEGRGDRITLYKGDEVLVDFIVGKKTPNSSDMYYVRRADEERIYTANLGNLQVSTKFADWIEKDILQVQQNDVKELVISRYYVDEAQGKVVQEGKIDITRDTPDAPWNLQDLKPETEKLKTAEIGTMLKSLEDLKIVGVRPKPESLIAGLKSKDGAISIDPFMARDLQQKGVFISKSGEFVYNEGKVNVGTQAGVLYELGFGEEFSGTDVDIEVGGTKSAAAEAEELAKQAEAETKPAGDGEAKADEKDAAKDAEKSDEKEENKDADGEPAKDGLKKSRYLFVTVYFDKSLLGPAPTRPVAPEKPDPAAEKPMADKPEADKPEAEKPADKPADDQPADKKPEEAAADKPAEAATEEKKEPAAEKEPVAPADAEKKPEETKPDPQKAYEEALKEYELQKEVYAAQKKAYDEKLKAGEKHVSELNARFAEWYYVISEEVFDKLKLKRADLVEPNTPPKTETKPEDPAAAAPGIKPEEPAAAAPADKPEEKPAPAATPASPESPKEPPAAEPAAAPANEKKEEPAAETPASPATDKKE